MKFSEKQQKEIDLAFRQMRQIEEGKKLHKMGFEDYEDMIYSDRKS